MAKKACKCKAAECEECPEWIFTFADLVMLMMGFFVILWVLKPNPTKQDETQDNRWIEVVAAIRKAFDYLPDPKSNDPVDKFMIEDLIRKLHDMKPLKGPGDGGKTKLERNGAEGTDADVMSIRPTNHAIVGSKVLFAPGEATLTPESKKALDEIGDKIRGFYTIFVIKGHTSADDLPEGSTEEQKMELSLRRAQAVEDYLVSQKVSRVVLRVQGCSTFEPISQGKPDLLYTNRRVEVESMAILLKDVQDNKKPVAPTGN